MQERAPAGASALQGVPRARRACVESGCSACAGCSLWCVRCVLAAFAALLTGQPVFDRMCRAWRITRCAVVCKHLLVHATRQHTCVRGEGLVCLQRAREKKTDFATRRGPCAVFAVRPVARSARVHCHFHYLL